MTERTYPYTAWTLSPSYKPVQVEIVGAHPGYWHRETHVNAATKTYALDDLFKTEALAIAAGRKRLILQQAKADRAQAKIDKRRAALDKAEASK